MGMAASQARYLGLTARKTNVEYEGQQINQARTALANQSAELWNQMLALQVPTAPNTTDYTDQQYSFSDGYNDYEIDSLQQVDKEIDGEKYNYLVTYHYNQDVYKGIQEKNSNPQVQKVNSITTSQGTEKNVSVEKDEENNNYTVSDATGQNTAVFKPCTDNDLQELQELASKGIIQIDDIEQMYKSEDEDGVKTFCKQEDLEKVKEEKAEELKYAQTMNDYSYKVGNSNAEKYDPDNLVQKTALEQIRHDFPELDNVSDDDLWVYSKNGKTIFVSESDLDTCEASGVANQQNDKYQISSSIDYQNTLNQYYATTMSEKVTNTEYARLDDVSGTGRYQSVKLASTSSSFSLNSETKTDETEYENAMQQYNYDIAQYEKTLADINAKTSLIQVEDRTLELRLKQLDTEQKALSTEMEAVKSVIQKNIETTFKTFSS